MTDTYVTSGWACTDCVMMLANGEMPNDMSAEDTEAWLTEFTERNVGYSVTLGMPMSEHNETCTRYTCSLAECDCVTDGECDCEHIEFTWSACDTCGGNLGGSRDAVSFFTVA